MHIPCAVHPAFTPLPPCSEISFASVRMMGKLRLQSRYDENTLVFRSSSLLHGYCHLLVQVRS